MAQAKPRGKTTKSSIILMLVLLLIGGGVAAGTLMLLGVDLPFMPKKTAEAKEQARISKDPNLAGKVVVPLCARPIAAYTQIQSDQLMDPKSKSMRVQYIDPDKVKEKGFITDAGSIVGRVMARDKTPGYAFTEGDFLPKGTRPSPTAGIEAGMRGMYVGVDQIEGLKVLKRNDRFDLLAVKPSSGKDRSNRQDATFVTPQVQAAQADQVWQSPSRVLVQNGKVIVPVQRDENPQARSRDEQQIFIAIAEGEVEQLTEALATGARITCLSRSALPGADGTSLPEPESPVPPQMIQVISGAKSSVTVVPAADQDGVAKNHPDE